MNTAIDVGNSFTKIGFFEKNSLKNVLQFETQPISNLYKNLSNNSLGKSILSSVVEIPEHINHYLQFKSTTLIELNSKSKLPIKINYKTPGTLGKDRIALAVGAHDIYPNENILVISLGTCVTYNFIDKKLGFMGGAISPGMFMRLKAMNSFTAKLPLPEIPRHIVFSEENINAGTTEEAVLQGAIYGLLQEIKGYIYTYAKKYPGLKIILSGGDSRYLADHLKNITEHEFITEPELVLAGLNKILQFNVTKTKDQ